VTNAQNYVENFNWWTIYKKHNCSSCFRRHDSCVWKVD